MASKPKAKVWNSRDGCFTDDGGNDNQSRRNRDQRSAQRRDYNNSREGWNEEPNIHGEGQQQRGNRNQQNRGNNRGQNQGHQNYRGQNRGHQSNRGQGQGHQNYRGQDQGHQNYRGQDQGHQDYRGQNQGHQNFRGQQGYENQWNQQDDQRGYYQGQGQQGRGQFQQPMNQNQQRGLLPEPIQHPYNSQPNMQYPQMMPPGPMYQPVVIGYMPPQQPPPLMNVPSYPSDNFTNSRGRGRQNSNRGQAHRRNDNMERSSSTMSIDSVGSHHDDRQGQEPRNRNNRGRGGHPPDREHRNMERSSSTMSIDSVGSHHDGRQESRNNNFRGRGRGAHRSDRGRVPRGNGNMGRSSSTLSIDSVGSEQHGQDFRDGPNREGGCGCNRRDTRNRQNDNPDYGARPKQFRNDTSRQQNRGCENAVQGNSRNRDRKQRGLPERPGGERNNRHGDENTDERGNTSRDRNPGEDNRPNFRNAERGGRRGRGRRYLRGNRRPLASRKMSVSDQSDQQSFGTVSEESDNERSHENQRFRGRGTSNTRRFVGRGNRGRGNITIRQRGALKSLLERDIVGAHPGKNEMNSELFERFLNSLSFRGRVPFRGPRGGRGRFFRGRWSGFVGNRKEGKDKDTSSTIGNFESDDQVSVSSEVSFADSSITDNVSEIGNEGNKFEICLDDIYTVKLHTLRNRVMRYKRKLADMRKKKEDKDEIKKYEDKVNTIRNAIQEREASEKKEMERKNLGTGKQKGKKEQKHENRSNPEKILSASEESETEIKLKEVRTKSKKMHGVTMSKGHVSFKPKTQKKVKGKPVIKTTTTEISDTESEDDIEGNNTDKEEGNEELNTEKTGTEKKKKRQRNRNRKKKKQEENEDKGNKEREKVLKDLLLRLDDISLQEQHTEKYEECSDGNLASKSTGSSLNDSSGSRSRGSSMNDPSVDFQTHKQEKTIYTIEKDPNVKSAEKCRKMSDTDFQTHEQEKTIYTREKDPNVKSAEKCRKVSESNPNGPDVNEVFKFMVKTLEGKGTPEEVKRESGLFPVDCSEICWFRKLKRRFTLIERNGTVEIVLVSNRDATYCLDYITNRSCSKADCKRYHVCKNLLAGNCVFGDRCKFSHNFLDDRNMIVSKRLGYNNVFSNEEICYILRVRYPHICHNWIDNGSCEEPYCIGLHLCPRYLLGQCLEGETCPLIHDKCSTHNKPIVDAYGMGTWVESIFKKMVYMVRQPGNEEHPVVETNQHVSEIPESASSRRERGDSSGQEHISQELEDSAVERAICERYLSGKCRRQRCRYLHCQRMSPYLWQVKLCGTWINLKELEEIEKAYCDNKEFSDEIRLLHNEMEFSAVIVFKPQIRAVAVVIGTQDGGIHTEARRLSTMSYKEEEDSTNSFRTQWRWYWMDDYNTWKLFDQDAMQHTLEVKFLGKQRDFNYSRENYRFKYVIDFNGMMQRNIGTRKLREINRRPVFVSLQNVKDKQFPASLTAAPVIETPLPQSWVPWDLAYPFELVTLDETTSDYKKVSDSFFGTLDRRQLEIDSIFRMQNHKLWSLYCNQEKSMLANLKRLGKEEQIDKRYLFHGTDSLDAVRGISINNFDARVSGKNATVYGDGAYFARDAKYSHAYTKGPERFMFMVTVLVGDYTVGNRSYRRPPNKPGSDHELYDSCVDNINDPSIFIIFDKNQYYPEYLIQYHKLYEEFSTEEVKMSTSTVRPTPIRTTSTGTVPGTVRSASSRTISTGTVPGAVGGVHSSISQPPIAPARRRAPSPPAAVYPPRSTSAGNTANQSSGLGGHSSVHYASDYSRPSGTTARSPFDGYSSTNTARSPTKDPVSPKKKDDSSCSIQ
ncbi:uncharacterized protein LOC123527460 [Mercenaria mercenaria]|uniref:uncharacterized protein LOC123527460 n=1 Tax=Mercenaria mercenaria TaxID=6596 RepID=UPI00234F49B0|nr:uncharacterized protein LOC123527460 [Mercenaria mercenaria]